MKKIFLLMTLCVSMAIFTGCESNPFNFVYDVNANGDADGIVNVTFPNGNLDLEGIAKLDFKWSNDTTDVVVNSAKVYDLRDARASHNAKVKKVAIAAENEVIDAFSAVAAKGLYEVHFLGDVTETATGITIHFDKTFTNKPTVVK